MIKRRLQVTLVCKTENGNSIEIGEGELGVRIDAVERFGTVVRLVRGRIGEPNSGFFNLDLDLSEKTIMAFRNAIEEAPEDPLAHLGNKAALQQQHPERPISIMASDPDDGGQRRMLIVISPEDSIEDFTRRLFNLRLYVGLFITPETASVVTDMHTSMEFDKNQFKVEKIDTKDLLRPTNASDEFSVRVKRWLVCMTGEYWYQYLTPKTRLLMVPQVIGNLSGAVLNEWEDENG